MRKIRGIFRRAKSGETLIETIVSLAIFSVVMLAVATMVIISYNVMEVSERQYGDINAAINTIEHHNMRPSVSAPSITYAVEAGGAAVEAPAQNDTDAVDLYEVGPAGANPQKGGGIQLFALRDD